jgi:hypothetical protein
MPGCALVGGDLAGWVGWWVPRSNPTLVLAYFFMFGLDIIAFCILACVFFDRAKIASIAGTMLFFVSFFPYLALDSSGRSGLAVPVLFLVRCL